MISKISYIKNFAVFQDFNWDNSICDADGNILEFKKNNIIFGHNYSGKTTLSRIVRSLERKKLPEKYDNPQFSIKINDVDIKETELETCSDTIRVFNEDFVRENLAFITNPDDASIVPFAVVGEGNVEITTKINDINDELGDEGKEEGHVKTKLYKEQEEKANAYQEAKKAYDDAQNSLNYKLSQKANGDREHSIKYDPIYGMPAYTFNALVRDINEILNTSYKPLTKEETQQKKEMVREEAKNNISEPKQLKISFEDINKTVRGLLSRKAGKSEKIEELVKDAALQKWVEQGKLLHQGKRTVCAFCGQEIHKNRWEQLEKHFDTEFAEINKSLDAQYKELQELINQVNACYALNKTEYYSNLSSDIDSFTAKWESLKTNIISYLKTLQEQIEGKRGKLFEPIEYNETKDFTGELDDIYATLIAIIQKHNGYTVSITTQKKEAQTALRYNTVYEFARTINYQREIQNVSKLDDTAKNKKKELDNINEIIDNKKKEIESLRKQINDEENGAKKVNEYLTGFFGHQYLSLDAYKDGEDKSYRFRIVRDGKPAYHLSEGECSLVAFCYFMARLEDNLTKGTQPIIWIDDPISSLDANHIFFIYSLINEKIASRDDSYQQLFISTHNLNFLKYLKRLPGADNEINNKPNEGKRKYRHLLVQRKNTCSDILLMPNYLKEYITEFNYLFKQIYDCATLDITDDNYATIYNFGNNARKFLELYLYYKYPKSMKDRDRYTKFFGSEDKIPTILIERINNEYSHLSGSFEIGETPVEVPEMKKDAMFILKTIKEKDEEQYNALLESIGASNE